MTSTRRLVLAVLLLATVLSVPLRASAASGLRPGLGYRGAGGDFVGSYRTSAGTTVYCIDPRKAAPTAISLATVRRARGLSTTVSQELAYALSAWGAARTKAQAAVESQVVNTLAGNSADVRRRGRSLPGRFARIVTEHVRAARSWHGPYTVRVRLTPLTPGQSATGTVVVDSAAGRAVPGVVLSLRGAPGVTVQTHAKADRAGVARFRYHVTGVGEVHVLATADALPATTVRASSPAPGQQRMLGWSSRTKAGGTASFRKQLSGTSHTYACNTTCDGRPLVALTACAPASTLASRIEYRIGRAVHSANFAASRTKVCRTLRLPLHDGDHVSAAWRYRAGRGWSEAVAVTGGFTVDCPAPPAVNVWLTYACQAATVRIGLASDAGTGAAAAWVNHTRHPMVLEIGGDETRRVVAAPGHTATFSATRSCSDPSTFTARAGVRRAGGGWNYGPLASVTTPGR